MKIYTYEKLLSIIFLILNQFIYCQNSPVLEKVNDSIFNAKELEIKPEFPDGQNQFLKLVMKKFQIPEKFYGKILLYFVIEKDGTLSNIKVENGNDEIYSEAMRVLKLSPKWNPGKYQDKIVRSRYCLPINILPPQ